MSRAASAPLRADIAVRRHGLTVTAAFEAAPGERWAVMGPSGAGKTTILEAIAGLAPLSAGSVRLGDEVISSPTRQAPPQRRGTVLLRQDPCLFPHLSARENVAFGMRSRGVSRGRSRSVADEWLDRVGLGGAGSRSPRELSGGQQQRVALARALAADPRVVLLDEPFTALDPETAASLRTVLADQLRASGTTSVLVTHDALDAAAVADRLLVMERGAVTQSGAVREVLQAPATPFGATIAGLNRVVGSIAAGRWRSGGMSVTTDRDAGTAVVFVRPADVRLGDPVDSASVSWRSSVVRLEPTVAGVRVFVAELAIDVAVTAAADLRPGSEVRLWVDPGALTWA